MQSLFDGPQLENESDLVDRLLGAAAAAAFFTAVAATVWFGTMEDVPVVVATLTGAFFGAAGRGLRDQQQRRIQKRREQRANATREALRSTYLDSKGVALAEALDRASEVQPFALYLRPFRLDGKVTLPNAKRGGRLTMSHHSEPAAIRLESALDKALPFDLISLGTPGHHDGPVQVLSTDAQWRSDVQCLAEHAECVVAVPSDTPGTMWEIKWLAQKRLLHKCVFVMPPDLDEDERVMWSGALEALAGSKMQLPAYKPKGLLFTLDERGEMKASAAFAPESLYAQIDEVRRARR